MGALLIRGLRALTLACLVAGCLSVGWATGGGEDQKFTAYNFWYEQPERLYSTGYQKGTMIPAGTAVTNVTIYSETIAFRIDRERYTIYFQPQHHRRLRIRAFANRLFTTSYFEELTRGFTASEIEAIKEGRARQGMSKEAVLVCFGPPPEVNNPSLESDDWTYNFDRFRKYHIFFADGKVSEVGRGGP